MGTLMDLENLDEPIRRKGDSNQKQVIIDHGKPTVELRYAVSREANFPFTVSNKTRYEREKLVLSTLNHPHLVKMLDFRDNVHGYAYIYLEYISPVSLKQMITSPRYSYTANTVLKLWQQLLSAASYLHRNNFIHRDIKPENIMMNKFGDLKVIDFEMAKYLCESITHSYDTGTKVYSPPEAMPEKGVDSMFDQKGDVYSIGVTMWEMVARRAIMGHLLKNIEDWRLVQERQPMFSCLSCEEAFSKIIEMCSAFSWVDRCTAQQALEKVEDIIWSFRYAKYERVPTFNQAKTRIDLPDGLNAKYLRDELLPQNFDDDAAPPVPTSPLPSDDAATNRSDGDQISPNLPFHGNLDLDETCAQYHCSSSSKNRVLPARIKIVEFGDSGGALPSVFGEIDWSEPTTTAAAQEPEIKWSDYILPFTRRETRASTETSSLDFSMSTITFSTDSPDDCSSMNGVGETTDDSPGLDETHLAAEQGHPNVLQPMAQPQNEPPPPADQENQRNQDPEEQESSKSFWSLFCCFSEET